MKKSNLIILAVLVAAVVGVWYAQNQEKQSTLEIQPDHFQIKDTSRVQKIFITDLDGNSATLTREKAGWKVNGKYWAEEKAVNNVFEPLVKMRIKAPASDQDKDELIKEMTVGHTKIEVFAEKSDLSRVYFIGNPTKDGFGTYVYTENEGLERPYIVHIPGWNGNIGPRFFTQEKEWRSKKIFRANPQNIDSLAIEYPNQRPYSFSISKSSKGNLKVYGPDGKYFENAKDKLAKRLMMQVPRLYFEAYIIKPRKGQVDSVVNLLPVLAKVKVKTKKKGLQTLVIKERPLDNTSFNPKDDIANDPDRYYAYLEGFENETLARLQKQMANKILKRFDRFKP